MFNVGDKVFVESAQLKISGVEGEVVEVNMSALYPYRVKLIDPSWEWAPVFIDRELTLISTLWQEGDKRNYPVYGVTQKWVDDNENLGWSREVAYYVAETDTWFISHDGMGRHFYNSYADLENDIAAE